MQPQISGNVSHKALNNQLTDPLINIYRQLRDKNAKDGDYFRINDRQIRFYPIYKISRSLQSKFSQQESQLSKKQSLFKDKSRQMYQAQSKFEQEQLPTYNFLYGSQIYINSVQFHNSEIEVIKPYMEQLYVTLKLKDKGYISSNDQGIEYHDSMHTSSIWLCMYRQKDGFGQFQEENGEVIFCNFEDGSYLYLDQSGVFMACSQQRSTKFVLKRVGDTLTYQLEGHNNLSQMVRNKSKQQIKKIIDKSIQRQGSSKKFIQIQVQISPVQDTQITIQLQLDYASKAIKQAPSLKLVKTIFDQLIYYGLLDFRRDKSLINQHLEQLLLSCRIFEYMSTFLIKFCNLTKRMSIKIPERKMALGKKKSSFAPKSMDKIDQMSMLQNTQAFSLYGNEELTQVIKVIGVLCRQNIQISREFLNFVGLLISNQMFKFAYELIYNNQYFISHFHKLGWYQDIYKSLMKHSKKQISMIIDFLCVFCSYESIYESTSTNLIYKQLPATNNQYLIYHSITMKGNDIQNKIFQFELYTQGAYVFVHDTKNGKDVQFQTFMEEVQQSQNQMDLHIHQEIMMMNPLEQNPTLLLAQLHCIKAITQNNNHNIIHSFLPIVYGLAPYCYQKNFPRLNNSFIIKAILDLLYCTQTSCTEAINSSKYMISFIQVREQEEKGLSKDTIKEMNSSLSQFFRILRKRYQQSRKLFKQLGQHILMMVKGWFEKIKNQKLTISDVYVSSKQTNLKEWLKIMTIYFGMRLTKVKEKKEGQLLSYFKKIFQTVQKQKKKQQNEADENVINCFIQFVLEILKFNPKYDKYLHHIRIKKNYESKFASQINKVISNFQTKKEVFFVRKHRGLTKIQLIDIIYKSLDKQNLKQSVNIMSVSHQFEENQMFEIKMVAAKILEFILRNVNEEMIDESVETLAYLVKNPNDLSNISSFGMLEMVPSFPLQKELKKVLLETWYFSSNCKQVNLLTTNLRLLYDKKSIFRRSINDVYLFDQPRLQAHFTLLVYPVKFIKNMTEACQTWLRSSLMEKYSEIYEGVLHYFELIAHTFETIRNLNQVDLISHIMQNLGLLKSIENLLNYMTTFYLEEQKVKIKDTRLFKIQDSPFVDSKLNPLSMSIIKILDIYMNNTRGINMRETKIAFFTLGEYLTSLVYFTPVFLKIFSRVESMSRQKLNLLLSYVSDSMLMNLFNNLPQTWIFFDVYCYLDHQYLVRNVQKLNSLCFRKNEYELDPIQELILITSYDPNYCYHQEVLQSIGVLASEYEHTHQVTFLKLLLKLAHSNFYNLEFMLDFRDKTFWQILKTIQLGYQKSQKGSTLSQQDIFRRRLLIQLAFQFKHSIIINPSTYVLMEGQQQVVSQVINCIKDFVKTEIKYALHALMISFGKTSISLGLDNIAQHLRYDYLSYLVCDLLVLAKDVRLLNDEDTMIFFRQCRELLKHQEKMRVISRDNDPNPAFLAKIDNILRLKEQDEETLKVRRIILPNLDQILEHQTQKKTKSKPLRKWDKAVNELNSQKFIHKGSELVEDMLQFDSIYVFKSDNENINLVLNHQDFFFKLIQISLNLKRLDLQIENQVFILEHIYLTIKKKLKSSKDDSADIENYAIKMLETIVEDENLGIVNRREANYIPWKTNILVLTIKLQIIYKSKYFERNPHRKDYFNALQNLFTVSFSNYESDCAFIDLYKTTLNSKEQHNVYECLIPFDILLTIILDQITFDNMEEHYNKFIHEIFRAYLSINTNYECSFRKYSTQDLHEVIDNIEKGQLASVYAEMEQIPYYKYLINLKK